MRDDDYTIKAATRRLVKRAGGVEAVQDAFGVHRSTISHAQNIGHDCTMQAGLVLAIEKDIEDPLVTREMANAQGYDLVRRNVVADAECPGFDALIVSAVKELGEAAEVLAGRNQFRDLAEFQQAEKEAVEAKEAAERLLAAVRARHPSLIRPFRAVKDDTDGSKWAAQ